MRAGWAIGLPVLMALAGCGQGFGAGWGHVDLPPDAVLARLHQADITGFRDARQCGMLIDFSRSDDTPGTLEWRVTSEGELVARFAVQVTPDKTGSRVALIIPKGPNGAEIYDGHQSYSHPAMMQPLRPALQELVDAAVAGRPFDWRRLPDPVNTDGLCGSLYSNFRASGAPYSIHDPSGMTHEQAEDLRQQGTSLTVEHDTIFADSGANAWSH